MSTDTIDAWFTPLHDIPGVVELPEPSTIAARKPLRIPIYIDGLLQSVPAEISVAAAMLMTGKDAFSTRPVHGSARAPYCMMGVCFECLVDIDGRTAQRACMTTVSAEMRISRRDVASRLPSEVSKTGTGPSSTLALGVVDAVADGDHPCGDSPNA